MADVTHAALSLVLVRDEQYGTAHFCADVDGTLVPVATYGLGLLDAAQKANEADGVHPGIRGAVEAPSTAKASKSKSKSE